MRRYTTPVLRLYVSGHDFTNAEAHVTIRQKCLEFEIVADSVTYDPEEDRTTLLVPLTQEQTGMLDPRNPAKVQVNFVWPDGARNATTVRSVNVSDNLLDRVVEYGG